MPAFFAFIRENVKNGSISLWCREKAVTLQRIWFSPTSGFGQCGDGAKMGTGWEAPTLPDAVSPFYQVAKSVTGVKAVSDGQSFEIFGKTAHL